VPTSETAIARKTNRDRSHIKSARNSASNTWVVCQDPLGPPVASNLMDAKSFLGLSRSGDNVWTFRVDERLITPGKFLFGGCGLAAGLVALEEASARPAIWACAQYLSYAPLGAQVDVTTHLVVVGGSVTQARATATFGAARFSPSTRHWAPGS